MEFTPEELRQAEGNLAKKLIEAFKNTGGVNGEYYKLIREDGSVEHCIRCSIALDFFVSAETLSEALEALNEEYECERPDFIGLYDLKETEDFIAEEYEKADAE